MVHADIIIELNVESNQLGLKFAIIRKFGSQQFARFATIRNNSQQQFAIIRNNHR